MWHATCNKYQGRYSYFVKMAFLLFQSSTQISVLTADKTEKTCRDSTPSTDISFGFVPNRKLPDIWQVQTILTGVQDCSQNLPGSCRAHTLIGSSRANYYRIKSL